MSPVYLAPHSGSERFTAPNTNPTRLEFILPTPDPGSDLWPNLVWSVATLGRTAGVINQEKCFALEIRVRYRGVRRAIVPDYAHAELSAF